MPAAFDVGQEVAVSLGSRHGAWRLIRRFAESWLTPLGDDDGWAEVELRAAERRLGSGCRRRSARHMPCSAAATTSPAARTGCSARRAGDRPDWRRAGLPGREPVGRGLGGAAGGDGAARPAGRGRPQFEEVGWEPYLERFSLACVEMVLSESLFADPWQLGDNRELDAVTGALLEGRFARLAIPAYPMWALPGGSVRWFTGPGVLLRDDGGTWLWVRARTMAALDAVRAALPGEWLMVPEV